MSEPTKRDLEMAKHLLDDTDTDDGGWATEPSVKKLALAFDAIRREERAKAEKLAEALRWLAEWQHGGRDPGHCNRKVEDCPHHACRRTIAALAAWEGAQHG